MTRDILISPRASARLVVTMPPTPSRLASALEKDIASDYVTFTPTTDAFLHLASIARERFTVMVPYIDRIGAEWAADIFETRQPKNASCSFVMQDNSAPVVRPQRGSKMQSRASLTTAAQILPRRRFTQKWCWRTVWLRM